MPVKYQGLDFEDVGRAHLSIAVLILHDELGLEGVRTSLQDAMDALTNNAGGAR